MSKISLLLLFLFVTVVVAAQPVYRLNDRPSAQIKAYAVLADHGYTLDKVRTDTALRFIPGDSLRPAHAGDYWLRIVVANRSRYDEAYNLSIQPSLNNTLYYFDANSQHWVAHQEGVNTPSRRRNGRMFPFVAAGQAETTLYVHVDVHLLHQFNQAIKPEITLEEQVITNEYEQFMLVTWIATLTVMFLFFLNNLFIYVNFRDKIVLYYLVTQIGAMIYVTEYKHFFHDLFPCPVFTIGLSPNGQLRYFDLGNVLQHISIMFMLYGQVQLTCTYLNMAKTLPRLNAVLRYSLYTYMLVSSMLLLTNVFFVYVEYNFVLWCHNVFAFLLVGGILCACVIGYARRLPAASPFLLANILPLAFMLATTTSHVLAKSNNPEKSLLPDLGAITQTLAFSIALVARTKSIQKELTARTVETQQLGFDMREMELKHQVTELENQKMNADIRHEKTRNELLQERLDINQRELASTTLYIVQKNELLASLKEQLAKLNKYYPSVGSERLKGIESLLQSNLYLDGDWEKFKVHFEQVHPDFFENLLVKHPSLTKYEIRLYAYFHINLSTKEIAALLNIDPASVRRSKTRLYKKMAITEPESHLDGTD